MLVTWFGLKCDKCGENLEQLSGENFHRVLEDAENDEWMIDAASGVHLCPCCKEPSNGD